MEQIERGKAMLTIYLRLKEKAEQGDLVAELLSAYVLELMTQQAREHSTLISVV